MDRRIGSVVVLALVVGSAVFAKDTKPADPGVKSPKSYREWSHSKSMVIFSDKHPLFNAFGGIHHIYVNDIARKAAKAHEPYADGSVIVFDLLEANESDGAYTEGVRKL